MIDTDMREWGRFDARSLSNLPKFLYGNRQVKSMIQLSAFSDEAAADLKGQIAALQGNNIGYTELRSIGGKNVSEFSEREGKEYEKELADNGIKVWAIGSPLGKTDITVNYEKYLDEVKRICVLANIFHTDKIRVFSFFNAYGERDKVFGYLNGMAETAKKFGVKLYHENEKEIYGDRSERVLEIMKNVKDMKFVYDPANFLQAGEDAEKTLSLLHKSSDYFHVKDISAAGELVPAGCGEGKIDKLIDMISDDKVLTLEPHLMTFECYGQIDGAPMKHKYCYKNRAEAFSAAAKALKVLLLEAGYREKDGGFERECKRD